MKKDQSHSELTEKILGCAIAVHRVLGPGFLEKIYEHALCIEFEYQGIPYQRQKSMPISYRSRPCGCHRFDLVIEGKVIVELKAIHSFEKIHYAMVLSYLKASNLPVALLLNFAEPTLAIRRFGNRFIKTGETKNPAAQENITALFKENRFLQ